MIKINLAPLDELENPYWYIPDLVGFLVIAFASWFFVQSYLESLQLEIDDIRQQAASYRESYNRLAPELRRFETLEKEIVELNGRIDALKRITESKIARYRPVIVLEHLQNLKPTGIWFSKLRLPEGDTVEMEGQGMDNLHIADFLTALLSTQGQAFEPGDLRTQVFFDELKLDRTLLEMQGQGPIAPYYTRFPKFVLKFRYRERGGANAGVPEAIPAPEDPQPVTLGPSEKKVFF